MQLKRLLRAKKILELLKEHQAPPPTPPPTSRVVSATVSPSATGRLTTDAGGAFSSPTILSFVIPYTMTGGGDLTVTAPGYHDMHSRVLLDPNMGTFTMLSVPPPVTAPPDVPVPVPPSSTDAFNLAAAVVASGDCPSVSQLPVISTMAEILLTNAEQGYSMNFPGRDTWPGVIPPGWQGAINHTLWMAECISGVWYVLPVKEALNAYCTLGPILSPGQVPSNLTYYAQSPMHGYQPAPYEVVGFFATTGDTRRMNLQGSLVGRTNVVTVPFAAGEYRW